MKRLKILLLLVAVLGLGAVAWVEIVTNFYGKPLDQATFSAPADGNIAQYVSATGKWTAQAITLVAGDIDELIRLEELSDVNTMTEAAGDLIQRNVGNTAWDKLAIGAVDTFLASTGTAAAYRLIVGTDVDELIKLEELSDVATMTEATGDIIYRTGGGVWDRLAIGTAGQMLVVTAGLPAWTSSGGAAITIKESGVTEIAAMTTLDVWGDHFDNEVSGATGVLFLATNSVTPSSLAADAVTSAKVLNGTLVSADLSSAAALTSAQILDGELVVGDLATALSVRLPPTPATNGGVVIDTGAAYTITAQGAANTVLHGVGAGTPTFSAIVSADITNGTITDADVAAANKDGTQGTASLRTLTGPPATLAAAAATGTSQTGSPSDHQHAAPTGNATGTAHPFTALVLRGDLVAQGSGTTLGVTISSCPAVGVTMAVSTTSYDAVQFTADALVVGYTGTSNSVTETKTLRDVSVTPSKATAGPAANGRDQAGAFSNASWVYLYVIAKHDYPASPAAGLWSSSPTAPTMPTGYSYRALVHPARIATVYGATDRFIFHSGKNRTVFYHYPNDTTNTLVNGGASTTSAELTAGPSLFPPQSRIGYCQAYFTDTDSVSQVNFHSFDANNLFASIYNPAVGGYAAITFPMPLSVGQTLFYKNSTTNGSTTVNAAGFAW